MDSVKPQRRYRVSRENLKTSPVSLTDRERLSPGTETREVFIRAYEQLRALARATQSPAVLVAAMSAYSREVEATILAPGHSLTLGRHTCCGLRLPAESISLRHLLAYAYAEAPDAAPVIRLWDLDTGRPFLTEDGRPNTAVIARGMLYAAVGEYSLLFVPTRGRKEPPWPARAEEAWRGLPPRQFLDQLTLHATGPSSPRLRADGQRLRTDISRTSPPWALGDQPEPEDAWGVVRLLLGRQVKKHRLSLEHLEQGVLLGRYERCGICLSAPLSISRVHLLLVRVGEDVLAIDTASSFGTQRDGERIATAKLRTQDTLTLGETLHLHWRRLQVVGHW